MSFHDSLILFEFFLDISFKFELYLIVILKLNLRAILNIPPWVAFQLLKQLISWYQYALNFVCRYYLFLHLKSVLHYELDRALLNIVLSFTQYRISYQVRSLLKRHIWVFGGTFYHFNRLNVLPKLFSDFLFKLFS
jgi:hypothetical protein